MLWNKRTVSQGGYVNKKFNISYDIKENVCFSLCYLPYFLQFIAFICLCLSYLAVAKKKHAKQRKCRKREVLRGKNGRKEKRELEDEVKKQVEKPVLSRIKQFLKT